MKCLLVIAVLVAAAAAHPGPHRTLVPNGIKPLTREMADFINSIDTTWKVRWISLTRADC